MYIRRMTENDLEAIWALRLQALTDSAEAFGSTYEETVARGKPPMLQRLRQGDDWFYLGAFEKGAFQEELIGVVGFAREHGLKDQHKGSVISMYVLPQKRGQGIARLLMQDLIEQVQRLPDLEQLHLAVVTTNAAAYRLYCSLGFELYGTMPRALKVGEQYWDEHLMVLYLTYADIPGD